MAITNVPEGIRAALAKSAQAASNARPDVGFGSRQPRPMEEPGKAGSWASDAQLTGIKVDWNDTLTYDWGTSKEDRKGFPAISFILSFVTRMPDGKAFSWSTSKYFWLLGDSDTDIPDEKKYFGARKRAREDRNIIMGWFQILLGTGADDPIIRKVDQCVQVVDAQLEKAKASSTAFMVKAGWVKTIRYYKDKEGKDRAAEDLSDYIYKSYFGQTESAPQA